MLVGNGSKSVQQSTFKSILFPVQTNGCLLAGLPPALLATVPPDFIAAATDKQAHVLTERLGVRHLSAVDFYR